jgi:dihydroxy-acid dehydratase
LKERQAKWAQEVADNNGIHPDCGEVSTRLLNRMRLSAVPAIQGSGMHPDRMLWVKDPRVPDMSTFRPTNKHHG